MSDLRIYEHLDQRSDEWFAARCGLVTASTIKSLITVGPPAATEVDCPTCGSPAPDPCLSMAKGKTPTPIKTIHEQRTVNAAELPPVVTGATGDTARGLIELLASERVTKHVEDGPVSRDMWRGIEAEPYARDLYVKHHAPVCEVGFMVRNFGDFALGYSPDGLVGDDGLIEIKAPRQRKEMLTILAGEVPPEHMAQLQAGLLVSGRKWIDFVSFASGMPFFVKRVKPHPGWQGALVGAARAAERAITAITDAYAEAAAGLPPTPRIDFDMEVVI